MRSVLRKLTGWLRASLSQQFLIPVLLMGVLVIAVSSAFAYSYFSRSLVESIEAVETDYMHMQADSINSTLHRYTQLLYGMVVDQDLISLTKKANALKSNQRADLNRTILDKLYGNMNTMELLASTLVLNDGNFIMYNRLTDTREGPRWYSSDNDLEGFNESLYELCARARKARYAVPGITPNRFRQDGLYFFHLACPVFDLYTRDILGVLVITVNTGTLRDAANPVGGNENSIGVLVGDDGTIVAHPDQRQLGKVLLLEPVKRPAENNAVLDRDSLVLTKPINRLGMVLYRVLDRGKLLMSAKRYTTTLIITLSGVVMGITLLILWVLRKVMRSIRTLQNGIYVVGCGDLNVRLPVGSEDEIGQITRAFNGMAMQLRETKRQESEQTQRALDALDRLRVAEIKTLEIQINSHFLHNTLNTINYTALNSGNQNVSNQIRCLSQILRYTFEKSDGVVAASRVANWLSDYLTLQTLRFGGAFDYDIQVSPEVGDWPMRKLLLQPFVENCVLHGFQGRDTGGMLTVRFQPHSAGMMRVTVRDNGAGMPREQVAQLNALFRGAPPSQESDGVALENVALRSHSYYGGRARVLIRSTLGQGTVVVLLLPPFGTEERS